jgi:hypothetical protein
MIECMFDSVSPAALLGEIEDCQREKSIVISRRMAATAALLWHRTHCCGTAPGKPGAHHLTTPGMR